MKKTKKIFIILLVLNFIYSCNSDENNLDHQSSNFYALTVGNSWEYNYYLRENATNNFLPTPVTETVDITETIVLNNKTYYNFKHIVNGNDGNYSSLPSNGERNYILRDSLGFLIDETGLIKYNNSNNNEYFVDQMNDEFYYFLKLSDMDNNIITNAGSFMCYDNHYYFKDGDGNQSNSLDHIYRENGKGEILSTMSFASQNEHFAEKRLESYSIQ